MVFVTVGTVLPFDRLVRAVDDAVGRGTIHDEVFAQIGASEYRPRHMEYAQELDKPRFDDAIRRADSLIAHAGIGTITMALQHGKPLLVMPRLHRYGEHVNDHQLGTAQKFEALGHVLVAYTEDALPEALARLPRFVASPRKAEPELVARRIERFLDELIPRG